MTESDVEDLSTILKDFMSENKNYIGGYIVLLVIYPLLYVTIQKLYSDLTQNKKDDSGKELLLAVSVTLALISFKNSLDNQFYSEVINLCS